MPWISFIPMTSICEWTRKLCTTTYTRTYWVRLFTPLFPREHSSRAIVLGSIEWNQVNIGQWTRTRERHCALNRRLFPHYETLSWWPSFRNQDVNRTTQFNGFASKNRIPLTQFCVRKEAESDVISNASFSGLSIFVLLLRRRASELVSLSQLRAFTSHSYSCSFSVLILKYSAPGYPCNILLLPTIIHSCRYTPSLSRFVDNVTRLRTLLLRCANT